MSTAKTEAAIPAAPAELPPLQPHRNYTFEETALYLAVTWFQVRNMVREGRIGYVKTGDKRGRRISGQQILDYNAANTVDPEA